MILKPIKNAAIIQVSKYITIDLIRWFVAPNFKICTYYILSTDDPDDICSSKNLRHKMFSKTWQFDKIEENSYEEISRYPNC